MPHYHIMCPQHLLTECGSRLSAWPCEAGVAKPAGAPGPGDAVLGEWDQGQGQKCWAHSLWEAPTGEHGCPKGIHLKDQKDSEPLWQPQWNMEHNQVTADLLQAAWVQKLCQGSDGTCELSHVHSVQTHVGEQLGIAVARVQGTEEGCGAASGRHLLWLLAMHSPDAIPVHPFQSVTAADAQWKWPNAYHGHPVPYLYQMLEVWQVPRLQGHSFQNSGILVSVNVKNKGFHVPNLDMCSHSHAHGFNKSMVIKVL